MAAPIYGPPIPGTPNVNDVSSALEKPAAQPTPTVGETALLPGQTRINGVIVDTGFSGNNAKSSSSTVTTSDSYGNAVNNLGSNITNGANTPPVINTGFGKIGYDPNQDPAVAADIAEKAASTKAQEDQLKLERDQAVKKLQDDQATETTKLTNTQNDETGSSTRNLLYLQQGGQSASAQAYLNKLSDTHTQEMNALSAKYLTAIQQAQNAYTAKDFALAEKYAAAAKTIKDDAYKRNQDFIDTTLKIAAETRQEQTAIYEQQKAQQTFNKDNKISSRFYQYPGSSVVFDSITGQPVTAEEYAKLGGAGQKAGFKDIQVIDPKANQQHSSAYVEWQDYVSQGGKLGFNDYQTMDQNRKERIAKAGAATTYNEMKDTAKQQAAGLIGGTFEKLAGPVDHYVSPEDYKKGLGKWTSAGYSADEFNKQFMNYLNPTDLARGNYGVTK